MSPEKSRVSGERLHAGMFVTVVEVLMAQLI